MFFWVLKRNSQLVPWKMPLFFLFALFLQFCATKLWECKAGQVFLDLLESTLHTSAFTMVFYEIVHKWGHTHHVIIMLISSGWNVCDLYLMTLVYFYVICSHPLFQRFHFPLSVSVVHYAMVFVIAAILRFLWELKTGKTRIILPWSVYLKRVLPTGERWKILLIVLKTSLQPQMFTSCLLRIVLPSIFWYLVRYLKIPQRINNSSIKYKTYVQVLNF